jgi:hypothetical protein
MEDFHGVGGETCFELLSDQRIGNAVIVAIHLNVVVDVHAHCLPLGQDIALGRKRLQCGSIQDGVERRPGPFPLAERTLIQALQEFRQSLVEIGEGEEFFVTQYGDQPAFCQEHCGLHFRFVPGFVGARGHNGNAVKLCHLQVGAIQIGLVAAGPSDAGARIVRYD